MFFGRSDHCHQWFYDGFFMLLPSLSMVFDGSGPLVKRWDGFDGSLWSRMLQSGCIPSLVDSGSLDTLRLSEDLQECPIASSVATREQTVQVLIVIIGVLSIFTEQLCVHH